jgi:hypothetical protein
MEDDPNSFKRGILKEREGENLAFFLKLNVIEIIYGYLTSYSFEKKIMA